MMILRTKRKKIKMHIQDQANKSGQLLDLSARPSIEGGEKEGNRPVIMVVKRMEALRVTLIMIRASQRM